MLPCYVQFVDRTSNSTIDAHHDSPETNTRFIRVLSRVWVTTKLITGSYEPPITIYFPTRKDRDPLREK